MIDWERGEERNGESTVRIEIHVEGRPPKKDGASSMWRKPVEQQRLKALRLAAMGSVLGIDWDPHANMALSVTVFASVRAGDLDNFVTGICDGLQAANQVQIDAKDWEDVPAEIRPDRHLLLVDDRTVQRITIERRELDGAGERYSLTLESLGAAAVDRSSGSRQDDSPRVPGTLR